MGPFCALRCLCPPPRSLDTPPRPSRARSRSLRTAPCTWHAVPFYYDLLTLTICLLSSTFVGDYHIAGIFS
ncbi:hypothetical protein DENSPDRAFT_846333 [Dentipellis sp. KUC8613]|nr:hypothetical protein DENSPDRAFT_846333 [Dentipellis sp. KUC8613]